MPKWKGIVGKAFTPAEFLEYIRELECGEWVPDFIVLHNTGVPTLAQYPNGLNQVYLNSAARYYQGLGWSAGPHLFVDDKKIWVFTPLTLPGVHSPSWNGESWGVEMLGDYEREEFDSGRGLEVQRNAIAAIAILSVTFDFDPWSMRLHREDPKTTHKCPGSNVDKEEFIQAVESYIQANDVFEV